jgi:hypothetical protein
MTKRPTEASLVGATWSTRAYRRMNERFVRAVRKAIAGGLESVTEIPVATAFVGVPGEPLEAAAEPERKNYCNDVQHIRSRACRQARR